MNTWKIVRTALALALIALSAISADARSLTSESAKPASLSDCSDTNIGELAECLLSQLAILESELKTVYLAALAKQSPTVKARLEKSQSAWTGFREADCLLRGAEMISASGQDLMVQQCRLEHVDQRIKHLRQLTI